MSDEFFCELLGIQGGEAMNWDMKLVNSSYEWVERELAFQPVVRGWQAAVRAGLLEANVTPWNGFTMDHVSGTKVGATTFDSSGRRRSAADLLAFARPGRLRVAIRATVTRIIMSPIEPGEMHSSSSTCLLVTLLPVQCFGKYLSERLTYDRIDVKCGHLVRPLELSFSSTYLL